MDADLINICWMRRDLRLEDQAALYHALKEGRPVLPVFVFDKNILDPLPKDDKRVIFIHRQLRQIDQELRAMGSRLHVIYDTPLHAWQSLSDTYTIGSVYCNHDYEPTAILRDATIRDFLQSKGIRFLTFKDQCIFEKDEILSGKGTFYTVFTPYSKKWKQTLDDHSFDPYPTQDYFGNFFKKENVPAIPSLESMGFDDSIMTFSDIDVEDELIRKYADQRDIPSIRGTSRLGIHLRFGTISIRALARRAKQLNDTYLNELIWRDFYMMIMYQVPTVVDEAFKQDFRSVQWRDDRESFELWCAGMTGYPFVDAGMRELNETGFMHNRARMITASFLTKHLLIDWRWGERYFAQKLLDFDLASNNGGWQWAASVGCDAAPYFRIFNPTLQAKRFDPERKYMRQWIPEIDTLSYPQPIIDHQFARKRALDTFKDAKEKQS